MLNVENISKAEFDFGKITKANSSVINGRLIYISKKDSSGNQTKIYIAFDYESKIQLGFYSDKEKLIDMLTRKLDSNILRILDKLNSDV